MFPSLVGGFFLRGRQFSWCRLLLWGTAFLLGVLFFVGQAFEPAAGFPAGLGPPYPPPSAPPNPAPCRGGPACPPLLLRSPCSRVLAKSRRPKWSKPPGLPCRPLRGARSLACHTGSHAGGRLSSPALPQAPVCGQAVLWGRLSSRLRRPLLTALHVTQCRAV